MTKTPPSNHKGIMRETLLRIGVVAPDTEFNRRAKLYAQVSDLNARSRQYQRAKNAKGKGK